MAPPARSAAPITAGVVEMQGIKSLHNDLIFASEKPQNAIKLQDTKSESLQCYVQYQ